MGLLIFLGIGEGDTEEICKEMAGKAARLRIFEDENGKMNLDVNQVSGSALVISQFTLYGDASKGNRPVSSWQRNRKRQNGFMSYSLPN